MIVYWTLVLIPAIAAFNERISKTQAKKKLILRMFMSIVFVIMAFRTVGGDFFIYNEMFEEVLKGRSFSDYLTVTEPIYGFFNWVSAELGWHIYGVNAFCALVFLYCLYRIIIQERLPILFFAISVTYFIIVVGIGYTRQGVAVALIMMAISYLRKAQIYRFIIAVLLAAGFHSSALVVFPLLLLSKRKSGSKVLSLALKFSITMVGVYAIAGVMSSQSDKYFQYYVADDHYHSDGAFLRSLVSAAAGIMFLLYRKKWSKQYGDNSLWMPFALVSLFFVPLSIIASTAVDRLGLFLLPFQLITFARVPTFQHSESNFIGIKALIICGYIVYFYTWLHLGTHSQALWTPYSWVLCC